MPWDTNHYFRSGSAIFLAATEEEYAQAFRDAGWSEKAIEQELELFRQYRSRYQAEPMAAPPPPEPDPTNQVDRAVLDLLQRRGTRSES